MSGVGTGYDLNASTYSPDGKIFQVSYALKAVENSASSIALRAKDGVVFGSEKLVLSKMLVEGTARRVCMVDYHVGITIAGLLADARQLITRCRTEAMDYRNFYGVAIPVRVLAERVANFCQVYTLYSSVRPFGAAILIGGWDEKGSQLYQVEPSGIATGCFGAAIGKGRQGARTEMEKLDFSTLTCAEAVKHVARIIHTVHDDIKDKEYELDLGWVCESSGHRYQDVPKHILEEVSKHAREQSKEVEMKE